MPCFGGAVARTTRRFFGFGLECMRVSNFAAMWSSRRSSPILTSCFDDVAGHGWGSTPWAQHRHATRPVDEDAQTWKLRQVAERRWVAASALRLVECDLVARQVVLGAVGGVA